MELELWHILLTSFGFAVCIMLLLWGLSVWLENSGIIDLGWTFLTGMFATYFALVSGELTPLRLLAAALPVFWAGRLLFYLVPRVLTEDEDPRYTALRQTWGTQYQPKMLGLFIIQAALSMTLAMPFLFGSFSDPLCYVQVAGILLFLLAFVGESSADDQLRRFKLNPENKGEVCRDGWWAFSRHPNYFFEFLIWVGFGVLTFHSGLTAFFCILSPLLMFAFLRFITGVPPSEKQAITSRGEKYVAYQQQVSPFFPWFPKVRSE